MSNERHLDIDNGTMGNLFRRTALAALGLDALDDVSEQSFEVIDRADAFAERLLGGISDVLPKTRADRMGTRTTELVDHIFEGMVGLNGPASATDLGEWQYWLDATLLMLFDEYDDEEETAALPGAARLQTKTAQRRLPANVTPQAVRERIAALSKAGVKPAMLRAMTSEQKRQVAAKVQKQAKTDGHSASIAPELIALSMKEALSAAESRARAAESFGELFAPNTRQLLASHLADKAKAVQIGAQSGDAQKDGDERVLAAARQWTDAVARFEQGAAGDMTAVRAMFRSLDALENIGAVTKTQAAGIRSNCRTLAKRALSEEIVRDVSLMAAKLEETSARMMNAKRPQLNAERAVGFSAAASGSHAVASLTRSFASIGSKIQSFNDAVLQYVLTSGETAATMRWQRASERFGRMGGISDDVDRILLRDIAESASALGDAGIVSREIVRDIAKAAATRRAADMSQSDAQNSMASRYAALADGKLNVSFAADSKRFAASPDIAQKLAERVEASVRAISDEMASFETSLSKTGLAEPAKLQSFASSIRSLIEKHQMTASDPMSIVRASSALETICDKLDDFAQSAASAVVSLGYDELTNELGVLIAPESEPKDAASSAVQSREAATVAEIRRQLSETHERAVASARRILTEQTAAHAKSIASAEAQLREAIGRARSTESLRSAQEMIRAHLSAAESQAIEQAIASASRSEASLESVKKQAQIIENAVKLSNRLREQLHSSAISSVALPRMIQMGDVEINPAYVSALSRSIATYSRIRDGYRSGRAGGEVGMSDDRIERMLSTVKPGGIASAGEAVLPGSGLWREAVSRSFIASDRGIVSAAGDIVMGYDELVPSSPELIRRAAQAYPSQDGIGDLTAIFGGQKAIERHAASVANGNIESVEALGRAVEKRLEGASRAGRLETYVAYGIDNDGGRVKVSLGANGKNTAFRPYELRREVGMSYMPESVRNIERIASAQGDVSLAISKRDDAMNVSGAREFTPVIAGANSESAMAANESERAVVSGQASLEAKASHSSRTQHAEISEIMSGIAARLGVDAISANGTANSDRMQLRVGNVNFDMSAQGFVDMLAKPVVQNAAFAAPSLADADNILFSGYASMLDRQGERRTLKSLRHAYMKSLAQAGRQSAHGDFGFNSQTFSGLMGNAPAAEAAQKQARSVKYAAPREVSGDEDRAFIAYRTIRRANAQSNADLDFAESTAAKTTPVSSSAAVSADFSWVSNAFAASARQGADVPASQASLENERQILTKIDAMLDYVEGKSQRDVGVFSSDDAVRVLLEALPASATLGNKGLPKWRQKDTKSSRIAEARELRAALASIGAAPIQGTQPFANKQYVSPNLLNGTQSAAPLFSGGSDAGSTPAASANASRASSDALDAPSISTEDLQTLAEDVFQRIIDSFNEELQRRRTE